MTRWALRIKVVFCVLFLSGLFWASWSILHVGVAWMLTPTDPELAYVPPPLSPEQEAECRTFNGGEAVESAIEQRVRIAQSMGKDDRTGHRRWRYDSMSQFKEMNTDCCEVLDRIPSDYPIKTQRLGAPYANPPRLHALRLDFKEWRPDGSVFTNYNVVLVDCFGRLGAQASFDLRRGLF
jgi:hypothetical protein